MSYTKGPWFVTGRMTLYVEARIGGGLIQEVAAVGPTEADGGYGETQRANANLMAAAPCLLEALEYAMPYLEACIPSPRNGVNSDGSVDINAIDRARAAIAKAKGEVSP